LQYCTIYNENILKFYFISIYNFKKIFQITKNQ
jgi:hypothetical protein